MPLSEISACMLSLTKSKNPQRTSALAKCRLKRAIGITYRPDTERYSYYFNTCLPRQFDEWIWFAEASAVHPLTTDQRRVYEPPHPFAVIGR